MEYDNGGDTDARRASGDESLIDGQSVFVTARYHLCADYIIVSIL
jgi:hypothetical protein